MDYDDGASHEPGLSLGAWYAGSSARLRRYVSFTSSLVHWFIGSLVVDLI